MQCVLWCVALSAVVMLAGACVAALDGPPQAARPAGLEPLRELAARRGMLIGAAVKPEKLDEERYAATVAREFSVVTPENAMKWARIHPGRDRFDWSPPDRLVGFAEEHGIAVHGHTLVWHNQNPDWLTGSEFSAEEMEAILVEHVRRVVGRYRGRIAIWDVVNEAVETDGSLRETIWARALGRRYLDVAFRAAHEADPDCTLIYNHYAAEVANAKSDAVYELLRRMLAEGVPVHGVGFQVHVKPGEVDPAGVLENVRRFAALGLGVYVTECDVRIELPATDEKLAEQARVYRGLVEACLAEPAVRAFQTWGFTDRYSWVPRFFEGEGAALIFDEEYAPKPAYRALAEALASGR
jgi:endo-1,4-beta-xylanase